MQQITIDNINTTSLSTVFVTTAAGLAPVKITTVYVTDSSYNNTAATAVSTAGGYIKIIGTGFIAGCQVLVNNVPAAATTYISSAEVGAQIAATAAGTYVLYVVNTDGGTAIRVNGITFSSVPTWATSSTLADGAVNSAVSIQLSASSDSTTTFAVASGSTLPAGLTLSTSGLLSGTVTGLSVATLYSFSVVATDLELQTNSRTFNITIQIGEPYFAYTTLLLSGDGTNAAQNNTFTDGSTNNFSITRNGTPTQGSFSPYGSNWSNYLNTGDKLTTPSSSAFDISSSTWTIEFWMYSLATPTAGNECRLLMAGNNGDAAGWSISYFNNGSIGYGRPYSGSPTGITAPAGTIALNTWYHVAVVCNAGSARVYINGTQAAGPVTISLPTSASQTLRIGYDDVGTVNFQYNGYISNLRIVKGVAVYTAAFTPPTTLLTATQSAGTNISAITGTATSFLACQSNRFIDNSSNNLALTITGSPRVHRYNPLGSSKIPYSTTVIGGSGYFNGSGDFLTVANNTAFSLSGGSYTIELWAYWNSVAGEQVLIERFTPASGPGYTLYKGSGGGISLYGSSTVINGTTIPVTGVWYHIAVAYDGTNTRIFMNGALEATSASNITDASTSLTIGVRSGGSTYFNGYMSDIRIVKGTARYTTAFTPPAAPLTAVTNTSLLTNFTNAGIYDSTAINNLTTVGTVQASITQVKYGTASMKFNGTTDYLVVSPNTLNNLGTSDFTIEGWVYLTSGSTYQYFIGATANLGMQIGLNVPISGTPTIAVATANGSWILNFGASITISSNTWTHIAVSRSGSTNRAFINGVQLGSNITDSTSWAFPNNTLQVGATLGAQFFSGYIDDLRITRGYARYTATFTPPAAALLGQ